MTKTISLYRNERAKCEAYLGPFNSHMAGKHTLSQEAGTGQSKSSLLVFPALSELYRKYFMSIVKLNSETVPTSRKK